MAWRRAGTPPTLQPPQPGGRRGRAVAVLAEGLQALAAGGALFSVPIALAVGKAALAGVLALIGLGIWIRLARRRRAARMPGPAIPLGPGMVLSGLAALGAAVETAVLVEATGLPVRQLQPGFAPSNWAWVPGTLAVLFWGQRALLRRLWQAWRPAADTPR